MECINKRHGSAANSIRGGRRALCVGAALLVFGCPRPTQADITIDFENEPVLTTQPSDFVTAGPMQTYTKPGFYTIDGGVVLGNPTFLPAFATQGSGSNLYGTTDIADPSLLPTITLTLPGAESVSSVTGVLFNGQPIPEDYTLSAFFGATQVDSVTFTGVSESFNSGFAKFSLFSASNPITSVTITTPNAGLNGWDFLVDTIHVTSHATSVPEPSGLALASIGMVVIAGLRRKRRN